MTGSCVVNAALEKGDKKDNFDEITKTYSSQLQARK